MQKQKHTDPVNDIMMCYTFQNRLIPLTKIIGRSCFVLFFLCSLPSAFGQIIWQEDFSGYPDGTTSGAGWSAGPAGQCDINPGQWGVFGGQFNGNDIEGYNCCPCAGGGPNNCGDNQNTITFGPFDISNYCDVQLNFTFGATGSMECVTGCGSPPPVGCVGIGHDQAVFSYSLDGGLPVEFGYYCGNSLCSGGPSFAGLNGSTISFTISMGNQATSENYFFDDMILQGNLRPTPVPMYNAPLCTGQTLNLTETGGAGTGWSWNGPGSFSSNQQNPSIPNVNMMNAGIYTVTVTNGGSCTGVQSVNVVINNGPTVNLGPNQTVCQGDPPIILDAGPGFSNYTWSPSGSGQTVTVNTGTPLPTTQYTVTVTDAGGCTGESSVFVTVDASPNINNPGNQQACDQYILPPITGQNLTGGQGYYTGPGGTGTNLPVGSVISSNTSLFIYDANGGCFDEESFSITITPSPMINNPGNLQACGSVTLPPITGTNLSGSEAYYDAPGGTGNTYFPGMSITNTTVLFIYDISGTCSSEVSFSVTIDQTPDITPLGDQVACDAYLLPPIIGTNLSGNESYYDGPAGSGTAYLPGQQIMMTTVLFIYDANGICTDEESFTVTINPSPDITPIGDQAACDSYLLPAISGSNLSGSEGYYDAPGGTGNFYLPGQLITNTITLFIYDINGTCSDEEFFNITINPTPDIDNPGDQDACDSYLLPAISGTNLSGSESYYDGPGGTGTVYLPGTFITTTTTLFIYDAQGTCSDEAFFNITITPSPSLDNPGDQNDCASYTLPAISGTNLSGSQGYFDGPGGTGTPYSPGDVITTTTIIYIYDISGNCTDEETFAITINAGPSVDNPGDQNICGDYTLPSITGTNLSGNEAYYSASGGMGTQYAAGDIINSSATIYVYDTDGSCSDEESFTITITPAPMLDNPGNSTACDSYTLPAISGSNLSGAAAYWSASGGTGTQYAAGDIISTTTTLFIYDASGSCTDEESFTITITPSPSLTAPADESVCDSYTLPAINGTNLSGNQAYWSASGGTGTQYVAGDIISATTTLFIYDASGSCTDEESFTITITPSPSLTALADETVCDSYTLPTISGTNLSGNQAYYSASGGTGIQYAAGEVISTTTTIYIYDNQGSCTDEVAFTITVNNSPEAGMNNAVTVCEGSILDLTTALQGADLGGVFNDDSGTGALSNNDFNTSGLSGSTYQFTYTLSASAPCVDDQAVISVTVATAVSAGADNSEVVCEGTSVNLFNLLSGADLGGSFNDDDGSGALSGGTLNTTGLSGTYQFTYTVGDGIVCPIDQSVIDVEIQASPEIDPMNDATACDQYTLPAISGSNLTANVAYFDQPGGNGTRFLPGDNISSSTILYIFDQNRNCEDETSFNVIITPSPVINPPSAVNECGSYTLPAIGGNNLSGNEAYFDQPNGGGTQFLTGQSITTSIILYLYDINGSCDDQESLQINITPAPSLTTIGDQDVCESYTLPTINGSNLSGNEAYFDQPNGGGNQFSAGDIITSSLTLYVFDQNGPNCQDELSFNITVNSQPEAGMNNTVSVCQGSQLDLTTALQGADPGGTFVDLDGTGGLSGNLFNTNGVPDGIYRFEYRLSAIAPCQADQAQITVEIVTSVTAGLDNSDNTCEGTTLNLIDLLDGADLGGTFNDNDGSGGLTGNNLNTAGLDGTFTFTYTVGDGIVCPVDQSTISVTVASTPQLDQPQDEQACDAFTLGAISGSNLSGNEAYYDASNGGGTSYLPGAIITSSTQLFIYDNNGNCDAEQSFVITIVPSVSAGDDNAVSVCEGAVLDLNTALSNADAGGIFTDLSSTGMLAGSNFNTAGLAIGAYDFTYTLSGTLPCPDDEARITVNIVNAVTAGNDNRITVCEGTTVDLIALLNGADLGGSFSDDSGSGGLTIDQFNSSGLAGGTFDFTYTVGDGNICPIDQSRLQVEVIAAPQLDPMMDVQACDDYTLPAISGANLSPGVGYYLAPDGGGVRLLPGEVITNNTILYIFDDNGSCTIETTFNISIIPSPNLDMPTAVNECGSYTLPLIGGSNLSGNEAYYTQSGGNGTMFMPGDVINMSTTLFLYDRNNNCEDEEQLLITITPGPSLTPVTDVVACDSYTLPAILGNDLSGNEAYFSMPGGNGNSFQAGDQITASTLLYLYDNNGGCETETSFNITINTSPNAGIDNTVSACLGATLDLSTALNGADPGGTFLDNDNTGALSGDQFNTSTSGSGTFRFDYIISGPPSCPDAQVTITVNVVNTVSAGSNNQLSVCSGTTLNLFDELISADLGGSFSDDDNSNALNNGSLNTTGLDGIYNFTYTVGDGVVCPIDQALITVEVIPTPDLDAIMDVEVCNSYTLPAINGSSLSPNVGYFDQPNGAGVAYQPGDVINGSIRLYAFDQNGICADETSFSITINDAPTINNLDISCNDITNEFTVTFTISNGDPSSYMVSGNTGTLNGNQFTSDPLASGTAYSFSVSDANNCGTDLLANVHNCACTGTEAGTLSPLSQRVCETGATQITSSNTSTNADDLLIFVLHDGDANTIGTILATNNTPSFVFINGLNYGQSYFVTAIAGTDDGNGSVLISDPCLSISEGVEVIFDPEITASISGDAQICAGDSVTLTFSLSGGASFDLIYSANGVQQNLANVNDGFQLRVGPMTTTIYTLDDVIVNGSACSFVQPSNAVTVEVSELGVQALASSDFGGFNTSCSDSEDGEATAQATSGIAPYDYAWSNGASTESISGLPAGTYTVTITDAAGCTALSSVSLSGPAAIEINVTAAQPSCPESSDGSIIIDNIGGGAAPLEYSLNGQLFSPISTLPLSIDGLPSGGYTLSIQDVNDCSVTQDIAVPEATPLVVELGNDVEVPLGDSIRIRANFNFTPDTIIWTSIVPLSCLQCSNPFVRPFETTTISILAIDENGCSASDQITVNVLRNRKVYIPTIFSPNGDGINDVFEIYGADNVANINSFQIFDRWGEVVFQHTNFQIGDPDGAWDGRLRGEAMNSAVFVYYAEIEFVDGSVRKFKGDVTLVR